jgi:hypothetical protein
MIMSLYSAIIPAAEFLRLAAIPAAASSPAIYCVRVEPMPNGAIALATEGHILAAMRYQDGEAYCSAPVSIRPVKALLTACRAKRRELRYVAVRAADQAVCVLVTPEFDGKSRWKSAVQPGGGIGQVMAAFPDALESANYPDWRKIVPSGTPSGVREKDGRHASIDPALLGKLDAWGPCSWDWNGANVIRVASSDDTRFAGLIMPRWNQLSSEQVVALVNDVFGVGT